MDGTWVRPPQEAAGTVIFVHGILSSGETCWKHDNGAYWPTLVSEEKSLSHLGIYVYTYQTGFDSGYYSVSNIVDDLKERLKSAPAGKGTIWQGGGPMLFVCHSMGGIVARKLIVKNKLELIDLGARIGLFLVASPSLGSSYANWVTTIARSRGHTQALTLKFGQDNTWLADLDGEFQDLKESHRIPMVGRELSEDKFIVRRLLWLIRRQIVEPFSAQRYFGNALKISGSDHFSVSKPASATAIAHLALVRFLQEDVARLMAMSPMRLRETRNDQSSATLAAEPVAPPAQAVVEAANDWPEEGGGGFVCVTERGSAGAKTVRSFQEYCDVFGSPLPAERSYSGLAVRGFFDNGGAFAVVARAVGTGACSAQALVPLGPAGATLVLMAKEVGSFGNRLQVEISPATRKGLRLKIRQASLAGAPGPSLLEDFDNISVVGGPGILRFIEYVNGRSAWIGGWVAARPLPDGDATLPPSGTWLLQGGADGIVTAESLLGSSRPGSDPGMRSGLAALAMSWHVGLVCIPDVAHPWLKAEDRERVIAALLAHCADQQATALLAAGTSKDELLQVRAPCDSAVAIAAWPWLSVASANTQQLVVIPPDGHVAGALAHSDRRQGVHKVPVPCKLTGTLGTAPAVAGNGEQLAELAREADRRGFNLLAMVDGKPKAFLRPLVTTALAEVDRDTTHRRLLMFITRRIRLGLGSVMFEPQSNELKQRISQQVEEFLRALWTHGALAGESTEEAYDVRVDADPSRPEAFMLTMQLTLAPDRCMINLAMPLSTSDSI